MSVAHKFSVRERMAGGRENRYQGGQQRVDIEETGINLTPLDIFPIANNVYYEWLPLPNRIKGILIPDYHKVAMRRGIVRACGPTCEMLKPGDKILVSIYTGVHLFLCTETDLTDGERHRMCREDEVISLYAEDKEESKNLTERHKDEQLQFIEG